MMKYYNVGNGYRIDENQTKNIADLIEKSGFTIVNDGRNVNNTRDVASVRSIDFDNNGARIGDFCQSVRSVMNTVTQSQGFLSNPEARELYKKEMVFFKDTDFPIEALIEEFDTRNKEIDRHQPRVGLSESTVAEFLEQHQISLYSNGTTYTASSSLNEIYEKNLNSVAHVISYVADSPNFRLTKTPEDEAFLNEFMRHKINFGIDDVAKELHNRELAHSNLQNVQENIHTQAQQLENGEIIAYSALMSNDDAKRNEYLEFSAKFENNIEEKIATEYVNLMKAYNPDLTVEGVTQLLENGSEKDILDMWQETHIVMTEAFNQRADIVGTELQFMMPHFEDKFKNIGNNTPRLELSKEVAAFLKENTDVLPYDESSQKAAVFTDLWKTEVDGCINLIEQLNDIAYNNPDARDEAAVLVTKLEDFAMDKVSSQLEVLNTGDNPNLVTSEDLTLSNKAALVNKLSNVDDSKIQSGADRVINNIVQLENYENTFEQSYSKEINAKA